MPSDGTGQAWNEAIPTDSGEVSDTGLEIREVKEAVRIRLNKEHVTLADGSLGGEHLAGSAIPFYQDSYPTLRPDTTTTLDNDDKGRLLLNTSSGNAWLEYWDGSAWQKVRQPDSQIAVAQVATGFGAGILAYAVYANQLGTTDTSEAAGTFTAGAWRTRVLNTEVLDAGNFGSLASNQITLGPGQYRVRVRAPAVEVGYHQARFQNITAGTTVAVGQVALSGTADGTETVSEAIGEFTINTGNKVFEAQHRCTTTRADFGTGAGPGTFGVVWTTCVVEIWKLK